MKQVFDGLKVADFSWAIMGPLITKYLADYGAAVVRIESTERPCILRTTLPFKDGVPGVDCSGYFAFFNANKYSVSLNMETPSGVALAKKLVLWADVVVENFRPGVMEKFGLSYEEIIKLNPSVVMLRSSTQGQTGRYKNYGSLGQPLSALSGFYHLTGWPDREPLALPVAYSDWVASRFGAAALIACLNKKLRTGEGSYIDISQFEASLQFILPVILQYSANKTIMERNGNANANTAPHAVYKCKGVDRWCAITVHSDKEWGGFCKMIGHPEWEEDDRFSTIEKRKKNEELLNQLIENWTVNYSPEEVTQIMQIAGICAGIVQNSQDVYLDKQLESRQAFWKREHPVLGNFSHLGQPAILSKTPASYKMPAPCLGEHNEYVCTNFLGLSTEEFIQLLEDGAFS